MARGQNREKLLEEGLRLFSEKGYAATGVQMVTDAAGIPKGSFYNYFGSKEAFAVAVLERYGDLARAAVSRALVEGNGSPLDRLGCLLDAMIDQMRGDEFAGGCLAGRLAQELAGEQPNFRRPLDQAFTQMQALFEACLREAQAEGELDPAADPVVLAEVIQCAWQGAALRAKAAHDARPLVVVRHFLLDQLRRPAVEA